MGNDYNNIVARNAGKRKSTASIRLGSFFSIFYSDRGSGQGISFGINYFSARVAWLPIAKE
jgi:hypothetical protein